MRHLKIQFTRVFTHRPGRRGHGRRRFDACQSLESRTMLAGVMGDFNGDGYDDLAVGAPGEDLGSIRDAGAVNVIYGGPTSGLHSLGDQLWHQNSKGIGGVAEAGDLFGSSLTVGDFNGDGVDDLAVGAPGEDWGAIIDAGAINVLYGSRSKGLHSFGDQVFSQDSGGIKGVAEANDRFASTLESGDFNNDGYDDLAIGVPGEDWGNIVNAGAINVIYGGPTKGLHNLGDQVFSQDSNGVKGLAEEGDRFGQSLAAGDFNGDGRDDLAIGAPSEDWGSISNAGALNVLYGSLKQGLQSFGDQVFSQDSSGIGGKAEAGDGFSRSLAAGDFNADGYADLAVGVPFEDWGQIENAGAVNVIYGGPTKGLHNVGDQVFSQDTNGMKEKAEAFDLFAASLTAADFNGDGRVDLAIGVPREDLTDAAPQTSPDPSRPGTGPLTGTIGGNFIPPSTAPTRQDAGAVQVIYGSRDRGLQSFGDQLWTQDSNGIAETAERGDQFGSSLTAGDFNGDGRNDLVIGVVGESVGGINNAGAVQVLYGSQKKGVQSFGDELWTQANPNIVGAAETGDLFGASFELL